VAPDLLIIGERREREDLFGRVEAFGYRGATASASELAHHLGDHPPAAILLCARAADVGDVRELLHTLRQDPQGLGIPVILHGELGGELRDLADVLELGADRFLVAPVDDEELRESLLELLGPSEPTALSQALGPDAESLPLRQRDPLLAQLRRTLAALDERSEAAASDSGGFDLDEIGLGGGPDLDAEVDAEAHGLAHLDVEPGTPPVLRPRPSSATLRLGDETAPPRQIARTDRHPRTPRPSAAAEPTRIVKTDRYPRSQPPVAAASRRRAPASESGTLRETPLPELLARLHGERFAGLLRVTGAGSIESEWVDGEPVAARSDRPEDRLSTALLRRGLIDAKTARDLQTRLADDALEELDRAIELRVIKPGERSAIIDEHVAQMLTTGFAWSSGGAWSIHPFSVEEPPPQRRCALRRPLAAVIAEGVLLELEEPTLREHLGEGEQRPRMRPGATVDDLDPPVEVTAIGDCIDGRLSLDEIADLGGRPLLAWIYALRVLGRLDLVGPSARATESDENALTIDRRRIRTALVPARKGDLFALLDLPVGASRGELRRAHHRLAQTFADARLEAQTRGEMAAELRELRAAIDEARDVLLDDALRAAYLAYSEA